MPFEWSFSVNTATWPLNESNVFTLYKRYKRSAGDLKPLFHSSQKPTRKLAANAFKYSDWMKVVAASLRVDFCDKWKERLKNTATETRCSVIQVLCATELYKVIMILWHFIRCGEFF